MDEAVLKIIKGIKEGYSVGVYQGRRYGLTKTVFNEGRSCKVYASELGGKDFISFNYYDTEKEMLLKPCEMPQRKVTDFLLGVTTE